MSAHPNVAVIDRMTQAIVENDRETLRHIFTDDMVFHGRGPIPFAGDHDGPMPGVAQRATPNRCRLDLSRVRGDGRRRAGLVSRARRAEGGRP